MADPSLTVRRAGKRQPQAFHQILVFAMRHEQFALPIQAVQKVILLGEVYGAAEAGVRLTLYQNREVPVIDLEHRVFETPPVTRAALPPAHARVNPPQLDPRYLLIVQHQGEPIGLPVESRPALRRVPVSAFAPLSPLYRAEGNLRCVTALIVPAPEHPPIFLLDLPQLFLPQPRSTLRGAEPPSLPERHLR
jgi:purine-binding chemotaxis protein CheW